MSSSGSILLNIAVLRAGRDGRDYLLRRILLEKVGKHSGGDRQDAQPGCRSSEARDVARSVLLGPKPGGVDGRSIADRVDQGDGNGTFSSRFGDDIRYPSLDQRRATVNGAEGEDSKDILGHAVVDSSDGDEENTADTGETANKLPLALVAISEVATRDDVDKRSHVRGNSVVWGRLVCNYRHD